MEAVAAMDGNVGASMGVVLEFAIWCAVVVVVVARWLSPASTREINPIAMVSSWLYGPVHPDDEARLPDLRRKVPLHCQLMHASATHAVYCWSPPLVLKNVVHERVCNVHDHTACAMYARVMHPHHTCGCHVKRNSKIKETICVCNRLSSVFSDVSVSTSVSSARTHSTPTQVEELRRSGSNTLDLRDVPLRALPGRELAPIAGCCTHIILTADASGLRLDPLRRWTPLLVSVTVSGSAVVAQEWLDALAALPHLRELDLSGCRVKDTNNSAMGLCSGLDLYEVRSPHPSLTFGAMLCSVSI